MDFRLLDIPAWPHWLKVKIVLTIVWHVAWSAFATASPPPPYVVIINDGTVEKPGMDYVDAKHPWQHLVAANAKWPGIELKHPFGMWDYRGKKMVLDQWTRLRAYAATHPEDLDAQARADDKAFAEDWSNRPAKQFLSIYVGGPWSLEAQPGEKPQQWAERAYKELKPIRDACPDAIVFDAARGSNVASVIDGPQGGAARLFKMLERDGITVGIEPGPTLGVERYYDLWNVFSAELAARAAAAGGWDKFRAGLDTAFRDPHKAPRCFFELAMRGLSDDKKLAAIKESQGRGEIPMIFVADMTPGLVEALK